MKIDLTNPNGIRCLTESKYCSENIDIVPTLQDKTVTPTASAQTVKADAGYAGLGAVEVTAAARTAIKSVDLSYGDQNVTYNSTDGIGLTGAGKVTYTDDTVDDITKDLEVPLVAKEGLKADASADNKKVEIKIDPAHSVYMATTPTATSAVPVKNGNAWSGIAATPSASASSVVTRDGNGRAQFGTPALDADAATKAYVDGKSSTIGKISDAAQADLKSISYCANADLPTAPVTTTEYALTDFISYDDLNSDLQTRIDGKPAIAGTIVNISTPENATNGTLTADELAALQASDNASIMLDHKKYYLEGKGHQEGYLTYTHTGYENNVHILESITITINTRAWVLNTTEVMDEAEIKAAITPMIPAIPAAPTWQTTAPTTEADKKKVQFTKVIISTTDDTNFPGMNGKHAIVPGFTNDGFHYETVVCSQADPAYEFPFIGSITSEMASGTIVKPGVAPTYISVVDPAVTFTYEYLW